MAGCLNRNSPVDYIDDEMLELVGECRTTGYAEDIAFGDSSLIYIAAGEAGIEIIDASNYSAPVLSGFVDPLSEENIVRVAAIPESNLLLSIRSSKKVSFWDITNSHTPIFKTSHMSDRTEGIFVWAQEKTGSADSVIIFAADRDDGLKINGFYWGFDPFNTIQTWWAIEDIGFEENVRGWPQFVTVVDSMIFLASDQVGVDIFRINDIFSEDVDFVKNMDTPGSARCCVVSDTVIYVADGNQGLAIFSGTSMEKMIYKRNLPTDGYAQWVEIIEDKLLLADGSNGVLLYDLENNIKPELISRYDIPYANIIRIKNNHIFVADKYNGLVILKLKI